MSNNRKRGKPGLGAGVRALRGGRTDFDPDFRRSVCQWLVMLRERYAAAERSWGARSNELNGALRDGMRKRFAALSAACDVLIADAVAPWSRVSWHRAAPALAELVMLAADDSAGPAGEQFGAAPSADQE